MILDVLIPTNGQLSKLEPLIGSIAAQTFQPDRILLLVHKQVTKDEIDLLRYFLTKGKSELFMQKLLFISHLNADYEPGNRRGYDRNYLISQAKAKFSFMIDHDNQFGPELFAQMATNYRELKKSFDKDILLSPTIMWRDTGEVQSQGITGFSYLFPKYHYSYMGAEYRQQVMMVGGNSLWGPTYLFKQFLFDERFKRSYEDIDFTYRIYKAGYPVIVLNKVEIQHMESPKTFLESRLMGDSESAFERARNRIWFVRKNATIWQKIAYFLCGIWLQTGWFVLIIMRYGSSDRRELLRSLRFGTIAGLLEDEAV